MEKLVKIHPNDNVLVVKREIAEGEIIQINGESVRFGKKIGLGHKIAEIPISKGERVIKFGIPIGSATTDILPGDHVHLHNLQSDYIPTYTHDNEFNK